MRIRIVIAAALGLALAGLNSFVGCASAPAVCPVSPIDIEEVKSDSRDLEVELAQVQSRLKVAQDDFARWQARVVDRRATVPRLRDELETLKKMSGVTEKIDIDIQPKQRRRDETDPLDVAPRN